MKQKKNNQDNFQKLLDKTYRFLGRRNRSEKEIVDYLKRKKASETDSQKIIEIFKEQKLIDDSAFAQWWLDQRAIFRPKGKKALKMELQQKGISSEIIDQVLTDFDELAMAKKALSKKRNLVDPQKITNFLLYRGFSWDTIKTVLAKKELVG